MVMLVERYVTVDERNEYSNKSNEKNLWNVQ